MPSSRNQDSKSTHAHAKPTSSQTAGTGSVLGKYKKPILYRTLWGIGFLLMLLAGLLLGYKYQDSLSSHWPFDLISLPPTSGPGIRVTDPNYNLIQPLLLCSEKTQFYEYQPLDKELNSYVSSKIKSGQAMDISVYYKDLNSGNWTGVNENDRYSPASLLKVAVMLAYLKLSESDPSTFSKGVLYNANDNLNSVEYYAATSTLKKGSQYSIADLIQDMIVNSDNNALTVLQSLLNSNSLNEVFTDLGLPLPSGDNNENAVDYISAKLYAHFFRVLYSATYVDRDLSQEALELLIQAHFPAGLAAGVPAGTPIASKFGERSILNSDGSVQYRELHDCGIVYKPGQPYIVCVMTKGKVDFPTLAGYIKDISAMVYKDGIQTK